MKFAVTLIAVSDMERSLKFYKEIFGEEVALDLGQNKTLKCGLCLQSGFDALVGFDREKIVHKPYDMELYFETEDMEGFLKVLDAHPEVERLHSLKTYPWCQRVIRIFDPDGHMIEVGESMESLACKLFASGLSVEETAAKTEHPVSIVKEWYKNYLSK